MKTGVRHDLSQPCVSFDPLVSREGKRESRRKERVQGKGDNEEAMPSRGRQAQKKKLRPRQQNKETEKKTLTFKSQ